jgi:hypothetical protein
MYVGLRRQENVERAVIVTYQVDMDWLMRRCPVLRRIPWSLIHGERHLGVSIGHLTRVTTTHLLMRTCAC